MKSPSVFISYSHKNEDWKDRLVSHLGVLQKQGLLEIWEDRQIEGGSNWLQEIESGINRAQVAVLMISADFLNSDFILGKEVPDLLKRREKDNLRILPLIVKPCVWGAVDWLNPIQAHPKDGKPLTGGSEFQIDSDLTAFATEIHELLEQVSEKVLTVDEAISVSPRKIEISRLPVTCPTLFGRESELEILDNAWADTQTRTITYTALGGIGKSALINAWLNKMDDHNYKGAELVYAWSLYSQGTKEKGQASPDGFLNDAFKWFGFTGEIPKTPHEKGRLLAEIMAKQKTLLIIDGLEPLQYPPGEMYGFLKDQTMKGFLKNLVRSMNGLCVITSRCTVEDLRVTEGAFSRTRELENLSEQAGMEVLKSYGLKGKDEEFTATSNEFRGHALALHLIGSYLHAFHDGDIRQIDFIPKLTEDEKHGGHARRVMESYVKWFTDSNKAELDVLNLLGLFDRPAVKEAVEVLIKAPAIKGLTERLQHLSNREWQLTLNHLSELRLIADKDKNNPGTIDCHPLIREHFGEKLEKQNPDGWREAHERLYDYYKKLPEKDLPDTLEEMEPLFAAVMHGCLAGKPLEAGNEIYWKRIKRGELHYSTKELGAFGADLSCLSSFFETLWEKTLSGLPEENQAAVLSWAGYHLQALGRLSEATQPMKAGFEIIYQQKIWPQAAIHAGNLSKLFLALGDVASAEKYGAQSAYLAGRSKVSGEIEINHCTHAHALHQAGKNKAAEKLFTKAERMQKRRKHVPEGSYLYSLRGFEFCELLLSMGKYKEVQMRAQRSIEIAESGNSLFDAPLARLTMGKALMLKSLDSNSSDFSKSKDYFNQAVDGLRQAGSQDYLPLGLLARANVFRLKNDFISSWADLDEVEEIAEYGQMRLYLTDYHLEACRNIQAQIADNSCFEIIENGEILTLTKKEMRAKFTLHLKEAERLVQKAGYHRRDEEVEGLNKYWKIIEGYTLL